ncbi:MAG: hypothetical protein ACRDF4_08765 [Rhabdochlamydiaceae bacterium]
MSGEANSFVEWVRSRTSRPFYIQNHKFQKNSSGTISIDRATFELEEAEEIGRMLLSINPVARLSAMIAIWERNGTLVKTVLVIAVLLLILVILFLRR